MEADTAVSIWICKQWQDETPPAYHIAILYRQSQDIFTHVQQYDQRIPKREVQEYFKNDPRDRTLFLIQELPA